MHNIKIQESLEHRILHGLSREWENALWLLPHHDRDRMKRPFFALKDMTRRLGSWANEKNELALSRSLVLNCSWDDVREVLFHEMAHQYAGQVLGAAGDPAHGPAFKTACRLLRASAKASAGFRPLHESLRDSEIHENDRILIRVKKLMSLAESRNPHEAEAAMAKAHALIKKYNIDLMRETSRRDFVSIFVGTPALRHPREAYHLADLLQTFYFIQGLWVSAYVLEKGKMGRVFEISGTVSNVNIASYVYDFVAATIHTQWHRYNAAKRLNRRRKTDFAVGIVKGFRSKLEAGEKPAAPPGTTRALIKTQDPLLKAYMAYRYPKTRSLQRAALNQDDTVVKDGYLIGNKLVISKGISHRQNSGRQLPHFRESGD